MIDFLRHSYHEVILYHLKAVLHISSPFFLFLYSHYISGASHLCDGAYTYPKQTELLSSVDQLRNKGVMHRIKRQKKRTNSRLFSFVKFSLFVTVQYLHSYLYSSIWLSQSHCYSALLISARYVSARLARSVPGKLSITCA